MSPRNVSAFYHHMFTGALLFVVSLDTYYVYTLTSDDLSVSVFPVSIPGCPSYVLSEVHKHNEFLWLFINWNDLLV